MNFVDRMLQLGLKKEELSVVTDQVGSPTWTRDLAAALIALARSGETGIFHAANSGACSRYEQVKLMFECAGLRDAAAAGGFLGLSPRRRRPGLFAAERGETAAQDRPHHAPVGGGAEPIRADGVADRRRPRDDAVRR